MNRDLFKRKQADPHEHPMRRLLQRRAQMDVESLDLAKRIVAEVNAQASTSPTERPMMSDEERRRFLNTLSVLETATQVEMLLRGALALYMARMHPADREMASDDLRAVQAEVSKRLARFRDETRGAVALAERVDAMFAREPMPQLQEFLETVLQRALGAARDDGNE